MRTISKQELKDILDKHGKWLRNEEGGERANLSDANLSYANLSYANLRSADLRYADLRFADLSDADLRFANLSDANLRSADLSYANLSDADLRFANLSSANLMIFQFNRHQAFFTFDGTLRIGCHVMPVTEWVLGFEEIGKAEGYSDLEIQAYGNFIKSCAELFKLAEHEKEGAK